MMAIATNVNAAASGSLLITQRCSVVLALMAWIAPIRPAGRRATRPTVY